MRDAFLSTLTHATSWYMRLITNAWEEDKLYANRNKIIRCPDMDMEGDELEPLQLLTMTAAVDVTVLNRFLYQ